MKILLSVISIAATIALTICSIALGWHLHIKKELEKEKGARITLDGDVTVDSRYYYIRVFESSGTLIQHLRVPRVNTNYTLDVTACQTPVEIIIKNKE